MTIDKDAELAKAMPKSNLSKLSASDRLVLKLADEFTPATSGDWVVVPSSVIAALNELAERVKALEP